MKTHIVILACLCGALTYALPVSNSDQENIDLVQIPLNGDKELDILTLGETGQLSERNKRTIGILRQLFPELTKNGDNSIDMAALTEQLQETIRVARQAEAEQAAQQAAANPEENETNSNDQQASESKAPAIDELTLDDEPEVAEDDRNKRFLSFNLGGGGSGGSGNFLFDIIRLFSGSVGTPQGDEKANAAISGEDTVSAGGDGYTEGIPGPVTRLFVLANRGIANLIQDLILRIAQTSERIVNFKARLITSLI